MSEEVDSLLKSINYAPNILEYYDNVTYNVRFYMLTHDYQQKLSLSREQGQLPANYQIPEENKIIIAETGVTSNYDITSLTIHTIHTNVSSSPSGTTYKLELRLKEINGCSLINKITAISKAIGYNSYILQPYHVDVWFSGYEQGTGNPVKIIGDKVYTYEVTIAENKSNIEMGGTVFNFVMMPVPQSAFNKNNNTLFNIGKIEIQSGTVGDYKRKIEKYLNEKYFEMHPKYKSILNNKAIVIEQLIDGDALVANANINKDSIDDDYVPTGETSEQSYEALDIESLRVYDNDQPQNSDKSDGSTLRPNNEDTFDTFFQNLCFHVKELESHIARPLYKTEYIQNIDGMEVQRIHIYVIFTKNNFTRYLIDASKNPNRDESEDKQEITKMQINEIQNLIKKGTLRKRYEWLFNGRDTSVLEINSSIDKLWIANLELPDGIKNYVESADTVSQSNIRDDIIAQIEHLKTANLAQASINEVMSKSYAPLDRVRTLAMDKKLYLDDIYACLGDKKYELLSGRKILKVYNQYSDAGNDTISTQIKPESIVAKAAYNNIFRAGNLIEIKMKILGDPYWLGLFSDNVLYAPKNDINASSFQHFAFKMNTAIDQKDDGTYDIESTVDFSTIYQLIESTSIFEDGKFIQELHGIIDQPFIFSARLGI